MPSYRKANVGNAAIQAASLMPKQLPMVTLSQKCVPGGRPTVVKIAEIMGVDVPAMDGCR